MFTHPELDYALEKAMDTAPGPDGIHYQMIKHLSPDAKEYLLSLYNRIWTEGVIPRDWKEATVLPILKPGKDPKDSSSYQAHCAYQLPMQGAEAHDQHPASVTAGVIRNISSLSVWFPPQQVCCRSPCGAGVGHS